MGTLVQCSGVEVHFNHPLGLTIIQLHDRLRHWLSGAENTMFWSRLGAVRHIARQQTESFNLMCLL